MTRRQCYKSGYQSEALLLGCSTSICSLDVLTKLSQLVSFCKIEMKCILLGWFWWLNEITEVKYFGHAYHVKYLLNNSFIYFK